MPATRAHSMMPVSNHDELAEQRFVVAFKSYISAQLDPAVRQLAEDAAQAARDESGEPPSLTQLRPQLAKNQLYQNWVSAMRSGQELMWQSAAECVDRQQDELNAIAATAPAIGSLQLDPEFVVPRYLAAADTHMMPGSYYYDPAGGGVRQGALFDKAASLYSLGRQGGQTNDMRGQTVVAHVYERFGDLQPTRILEMGCTVGNSLVAVAGAFPQAEVHGIDVGASLLRYAHARAAHLGAALHFRQADAEQTGYPDEHFDLVFSSAVLHETSAKALPRIMEECYRILRPGGVMAHLEVPLRAEAATPFDLVRADFETRYNNEPFWLGAVSADLAGLATRAGFVDVAAGFQDAAMGPPRRDVRGGFPTANKGVYRSWYLASGRKPQA